MINYPKVITRTYLNIVKHFEGLHLEAYHGELDPPGVWTLGYGMTHGIKEGMKVSERMAETSLVGYLYQDLAWIDQKGILPTNVSVGCTTAYLDLAYNCGRGIMDWNTVKLLNKGDWKGAIVEYLDACKAQGKPVKGLLRRRRAMVLYWLYGESNWPDWPDDFLSWKEQNNYRPSWLTHQQWSQGLK